MDVFEAVARRMSVRAFKPDPVPGEVVRELIEAAHQAPSGGNLQPWHVYALAGEPLRDLSERIVGKREKPAYEVYPASLWDPYRSRRFACGEDLYASIGIAREDKAGRLTQFANNGRLFGAPVGLFFCIDRRMGPPQWSDVGMYMQTFMLLAVARGLDTCAQEFWSAFPDTVADVLGLPEDLMIFSGMALGYRDDDHPINNWRTTRAPFEEYASMRGFES